MTKRGRAVNGDRFELRHPSMPLNMPFTTFIDVAFRGATYQVLTAADRNAFSYAATTGEFTVGELRGHVVEVLDTVETQVSHRYQALVASDTGVLSVHSYESVEALLHLVGALRPSETDLGLAVTPDDEIEFTSAPRVALQLDFGVVEITPLTAEVNDQLPDWQGSPVAGGELYGGRLTGESPYLTLVTPSCRVLVLPGNNADPDQIAEILAELQADWRT